MKAAEQERVTFEVIQDSARFMKMGPEWNRLLRSSASDCLFLTWEWLSTWWRHLSRDRKLFIAAVRSDGELIAVAPLVVRPAGLSSAMPFPALEFMGGGSVGSDYLDLIVRRKREAPALQALAECLAGTGRPVDLHQLKVEESAAAALGGLLAERGWKVVAETNNLARYVSLEGRPWPEYLASLGRAHRQNFTRRHRQLTRSFAVRFERASGEAERLPALRRLIALHEARWRERGTSNAFHTPNHLRFHEDISALAVRRGWLRLYTLWLDDEAAAALYGFLYRGVFYFYQSGFDPAYARFSTGLVTMGLVIKDAAGEGVREFDMLQGIERYKQHWARQSRPLGSLELHPPQLRGLVYRRAMALSRAAKRAARRMLPERLARRLASGRTPPAGR